MSHLRRTLRRRAYLRGYREGICCARKGAPPPKPFAVQPPEYRVGFDAGRYWWWTHHHDAA